MREVTPETAAEYLRETGRVPEGRAIQVRALGWGVSSIVMRVDVEGEPPLVLKQSRERLRTEAHWVSQLDRIWTEQAALELLATVLPRGTVPEVVFADPENYLLAMTCAPDDSVVWKERLLSGNKESPSADEADVTAARQAGEILGTMHAATVGHRALAGRLADTLVFDQLRIDPFYRTVARAHPDLRPHLDRLIALMAAPETRTFVHADFSPKNILVHAGGLTVVDFETAHAGDPAFDLGFFLSHLLLKAFRATAREASSPKRPWFLDSPYFKLIQLFWAAYRERTGILDSGEPAQRAIAHAAACALARVDGKSPVDYLDDQAKDAVREFARDTLMGRQLGWTSLLPLAV